MAWSALAAPAAPDGRTGERLSRRQCGSRPGPVFSVFLSINRVYEPAVAVQLPGRQAGTSRRPSIPPPPRKRKRPWLQRAQQGGLAAVMPAVMNWMLTSSRQLGTPCTITWPPIESASPRTYKALPRTPFPRPLPLAGGALAPPPVHACSCRRSVAAAHTGRSPLSTLQLPESSCRLPAAGLPTLAVSAAPPVPLGAQAVPNGRGGRPAAGALLGGDALQRGAGPVLSGGLGGRV